MYFTPARRTLMQGLTLGLLWVISASLPTYAQKYTFTKIADTQQGFNGFARNFVEINNSGEVLFYASRTLFTPGLYLATAGDIVTIKEGSIGVSLLRGSFNDKGAVVVSETTPANSTISVKRNGESRLVLDSTTSEFASLGGVVINNNETIVFGAVTDTGDGGIFAISGGQPRALVMRSEFGSLLTTIGGADYNDAETLVVLVENVLALTGQILIVGQDGSRRTIAEAIPVMGGAITSFSDPALNNNNVVAFVSAVFDPVNLGTKASLLTGTSADSLVTVFSVTSSPTDPFALLGKVFPRDNVAINNAGVIAFRGSLDGNLGIFTGPDPIGDKVVGEGDSLFGSRIAALGEENDAGSGYLNDQGQIAFYFELENGVTGIAVATPAGGVDGGPSLPANSVVNAASFTPVGQPNSAPARGSIVSVFGADFASGLTAAQTTPLPTELAGVSVTFNGLAAPLFFVAPGQINAQLPYEINGDTVEVKVTSTAGESSTRAVAIAATSPSLFTLDQSGSGQGIVVFANSATLAAPAGLLGDSRPARSGDVLTIFANGLGAVIPPIASGVNSCDPNGACAADFSNLVLRSTVVRPTIQIGSAEVPDGNIVFSGLAPQFVALYQINLVLPDGLPSGAAVPIVIRLGATSSRGDVTIAIE